MLSPTVSIANNYGVSPSTDPYVQHRHLPVHNGQRNAFVKGLVNGWDLGITTFASGIELSAATLGLSPLLRSGRTRINNQAVNGTDALNATIRNLPNREPGSQQFINGACFAPGRLRNGPTMFDYYLQPVSTARPVAVQELHHWRGQAPADPRLRLQLVNHPLWTFRSNDTNSISTTSRKLSNLGTFYARRLAAA
jgi:hypothetical protein